MYIYRQISISKFLYIYFKSSPVFFSEDIEKMETLHILERELFISKQFIQFKSRNIHFVSIGLIFRWRIKSQNRCEQKRKIRYLKMKQKWN